MHDFESLCASHNQNPPSTTLVWQAVVEIGERQDLGVTPRGARFLIPITGGTFKGAFASHRLSGTVLPGGADRQLLRGDGVKELDALYEMKTDDGAVLTIHNKVLIDDRPGHPRYAHSHVLVQAPTGPHDWLNRLALVGTLHPLPPERRAVLIRVWALQG